MYKMTFSDVLTSLSTQINALNANPGDIDGVLEEIK